MTTILPASVLGDVHYPSADGKPMAETPVHRQVMVDLIETLDSRFLDDPWVYVSGNMLLYYVEGDPRRHVSPDVFMVRGIRKDQPRDVYLVWREKKSPDVVFEITSKSTAQADQEVKFFLYQDVLKVKELFLFDPRSEYLQPSFQGHRLIDGRYAPIEPVDGRLPSEVLGLHFEGQGQQLRVYDPAAGRVLLLAREQLVDARKQMADAETGRQRAEQEAEHLRRQLQELRQRLPPEP